MTDERDPFEQGRRAARAFIPAEANPHPDGSEAAARWREGHRDAAMTIEAGESEGR